jgi:putative ABC transport system ATP-binding protein
MLELKHVEKVYRVGTEDFHALRDVSLKIESGAFLAFIGPSGSGKTTLLNLVGGLDRPSEGEIILEGRNLADLNKDQLAELRRKRIGFIFQFHNLLPVYNVYENVLFPLLLNEEKESDVRDSVMNIVERVGLAGLEKKKPTELSGGQCQRVAIARALIKKPSLVLADEPTANLDAENSRAILELTSELNREFGCAFLFSTHDDKLIQYVNRKIKLDDGRVISDVNGSNEEIKS